LNFGGGKAVIIGDPKEIKTPELMQAFGRFINQSPEWIVYHSRRRGDKSRRHGKYSHKETSHVVGLGEVKTAVVGTHPSIRLMAFISESKPSYHEKNWKTSP
jgi:hypothetical protein